MTVSSGKYKALDDAILERIKAGGATFSHMESSLSEIADKLVEPDRWGDKSGWRLIDRRLQAMRKAGLIKHDRMNGWATV